MQNSNINIFGSTLNTTLQSVLLADDIQPGSDPSYQLCKTIYLNHPLGAKIVETPIKIAQSQPRTIMVENSPEQEVRDAFMKEWQALKADYYIRGTMYQSRIYGAGSLIVGAIDHPTVEAIDPWELPKKNVYFNILDPLNTAGSLVLDQNPNSPTFQKHGDVTASGQPYHRSSACVIFNEQPIYIAYNSASFGFNGRSVYQRALYPLKSFIRSMITDDMVTTKAGLIIAMLKNAGSIINRVMQAAAGIKRALLREAQTNNVLSIDIEEKIESINLQNTDTAMTTARSNIIKNIATACDMPAMILEQESFAQGFGEGTEDTKNIIRFVNGVRCEMQPLYDFMDKIVQHRAWNEDFYTAMQTAHPDMYEGRSYEEVFYEWQANFKATWPSLLEESESEQSKMEKVKLEGLVSVFEQISGAVDPENKAQLVEWLQDNVNELKKMFKVPMVLDIDALKNYTPPEPAAPEISNERTSLSLVK